MNSVAVPPASHPVPDLPRETQLDGLRCLAYLAVFFLHARTEWAPWGWVGVQLFFALSGFLITRVLVRGETGDLRADLGRFYWRRTLRIFPIYYAVLAWVALTGGVPHLPWYFLYLSNVRGFLDGSIGGSIPHFWTLAVEEQFYLLYPLVLLLTPARGRVALILGLIAASKAFQVYAHARLAMPVSRILLPYCGEDLLWGCLAGLVDLRWARRRTGAATLLFVVGIGLMVAGYVLRDLGPPGYGGPRASLGVSALALGSAGVVLGAWRTSNPAILAPLRLPPMVTLGQISYGLYVFHMPVVMNEWVLAIPFAFLIPKPWGAFLLTLALAVASWRWLERPLLRLKDREPREVLRAGIARIRRLARPPGQNEEGRLAPPGGPG